MTWKFTQANPKRREMIDCINRGIGGCEPLGNGRFIVSGRLNPEQRQVVELVLGSRDRVVSISGAAGAGKTVTLQELHRGLRDAGRDIVALAPTVSAVGAQEDRSVA